MPLLLATLNCMLIPTSDVSQRAAAAAEWLRSVLHRVDVVVLTEVFSPTAFHILYTRLRLVWPYMVRPLHNTRGANGGVLLLSKWPLTHVYAMFYSQAVHSDALAAKGAVAAIVRPRTAAPMLVVGTHMQAGGDPASCAVRAHQWTELNWFLRGFLATAAPQVPRLVCGDFNEDTGTAGNALRTHYLQSIPTPRAHGVSYDLVNNDIAAARAQKGDVTSMLDGVAVDQCTQHVTYCAGALLRPRDPLGDAFTDHEAIVAAVAFARTRHQAGAWGAQSSNYGSPRL